MLIIVDKTPVCVLEGLMSDGQFYDEDEKAMFCREAVERGVVTLRQTFPDITPQECFQRVLKAVCTAANQSQRNEELEGKVAMAYMVHHSVIERFMVTQDSNSWYPASQGDS